MSDIDRKDWPVPDDLFNYQGVLDKAKAEYVDRSGEFNPGPVIVATLKDGFEQRFLYPG